MKEGQEIFINKNSKVGILMLHGFSSTPGEFKKLSVFLAEKGFNVSAPVIAGHGTSPEDLKKTSSSDWKKSVMDAYLKLKNISEKVFIIGNSFGSNLGLWLVKELNNEPAGIITLGAPVFFRFNNFLKFRLYTYGRFKKYYKKPAWLCKKDPIDGSDCVTYSSVAIKNLYQGFDFLDHETIPNLPKVKIPILVASATVDPLIHRKSAKHIFENVSSLKKQIFWFESRKHDIVENGDEGLFLKIHAFIKEIIG